MNTSEKKKIKWLFSQPEDIILQAIKLQRDLFFKLRSENKDKDMGPDRLTLLSLRKAAEYFYNLESPTKFKNPDRDLKTLNRKVLDRIERHKIRYLDKSKKRESKKKIKIMGLLTEIKIMREQNQSFRAISDYVKKYHRLAVHPTYISKILAEHQEGK
ncbi:MAG: hypothetical protein BWY26_01653 [Elusimicrobia bacterium ADurb.Bin231]|nr:MAG: hypothetical protein BWY26_01653 [Elusimicrobia bacterium ADurb.Bin231]